MNTFTVVFALAWLVVFFTSFADYGAVPAAIGGILIAGVFAGVAWAVCIDERRRYGISGGPRSGSGLRTNRGISRRRRLIR